VSAAGRWFRAAPRRAAAAADSQHLCAVLL
jgi:hypothetical protein